MVLDSSGLSDSCCGTVAGRGAATEKHLAPYTSPGGKRLLPLFIMCALIVTGSVNAEDTREQGRMAEDLTEYYHDRLLDLERWKIELGL